MRRSGLTLFLFLAVLLVPVVAAGAASGGARRTLAATCYPNAITPTITSHQTRGRGDAACDNNSVSWNFNVRLSNRAGNILTQSSGGPVYGTAQVSTVTVVCTGAIVHSFLYINVGGVGKSDTSAEANSGNPC
jgi:hypothetical protein